MITFSRVSSFSFLHLYVQYITTAMITVAPILMKKAATFLIPYRT